MAVAATVLTAGAAAVAMGAVTGAASTFGAGLTALSGGLAGSGSLATAAAAGTVAASTGVGVAAVGAAALGGAAGSIAGQSMGMALSNRDSFSWREVALSAVGSAIGSGVGQSGLGQLTFGLQGNGASIASAMARSAITSSALQAVSLGTDSQGRFSWRAVAASAVGAGVGAGMGAAFGASAPPGGIGMTPAERFGELARGTVYSIAAGSAASAIGSGRVMARQVAVDAFGNALGESIVAQSQTQGYGPNSARDYENGADIADSTAVRRVDANTIIDNRAYASSLAANEFYGQLVGVMSNPSAGDSSDATLLAASNGFTGLGRESSSASGGGLKVDPSRLPRFWTSDTFESRYAPSLGLKEVGDYFSGFGSGLKNGFSLSGVVDGVSGFVSGLVTDFGGTLESNGLAMQARVRQLFRAGRSGDFTTAGRIEGQMLGEQAAGLALGYGVGQGLKLGAAAFNTVGGITSNLISSSLAPYTSVRLGASSLSSRATEYGVAFFGDTNLGYYTRQNATIGRAEKPFFFMPLADSAVVRDAADAARYTGRAPSAEAA
jgi:hypothetical protein